MAVTALVGSDLVGLSAPVAAAPAGQGDGQGGATIPAQEAGLSRTAATWEEPVAGTSAEIEFTDAGPSARAASLSPHLAEIVREAKRVRTVDIDAGALDPSLAAESVAIELFDDVDLALETTVALSEGVATRDRSSSTYSAGGEDGTAVVTIVGEDVRGTLWKGSTRYGIEPLGGGRHLVFEDGRTFPDEAAPVARDGDATVAPPPTTPAGPSTLATPVIDVMVAFDEDAKAMFGSVAATEAEIMEMVNVTNMTYANSRIDLQLVLANTLDLNYTPNPTDGTTDDGDYLDAIQEKTDGIVDNLHTERDANSADLVAVITDASTVCGKGYLPAGSSNPAEERAYSIVDGDCAVDNLSFPHEIGHNLCAHHDLESVGSTSCGPDAFAHFSVTDNLRTVMSTANVTGLCSSCERIPYFSNPDVTTSGWTTGILGSRDNSRVMRVRAVDVATYRPVPPSCRVDYTITSTWPGNVQVDLVVENTTTSWIRGWTAKWAFTGDENVYNHWGVAISQIGPDATATGDGFGVMIPPGGNVAVGFQATVTGTPTVPSPITCEV